MQNKSIRLTNQVRDELIGKLLDNAFGEKANQIKEWRFDFSEKVYNDIYDKKTREAMLALPDGWLAEKTEFHVQFGGDSRGYCERMLREPKRFLAKHSRGAIKVFDVSHKLTIEHGKIDVAIEDLRQERRTAEQQARAVIYSCTTTAHLKSTWPEIADEVVQFEPKGETDKANAIIPVMEGLNERLGLVKR